MIKKNVPVSGLGRRFQKLIAVGLMAGVSTMSMGAPVFAQGAGSKASAPSAEETKRVLELIRTANDAYDAEDFERAYGLYLEASKVLPQPVVLYRLGMSAEKLGRTRDAVRHYEELLAMDAGSDTARTVRSRLPELRAKLPAVVKVDSTPSGASVYLGETNGKLLGKTPLETEVQAGESTFVVSFPSHRTASQTVKLEAGTEQQLKFDLVEYDEVAEELAQEGKEAAMGELESRRAAAAARAESEVAGMEPRLQEEVRQIDPVRVSEESGSGLQVLSWVLIGTGVAAVAGGGVLNYLQNTKTDDVNAYNKRAPGASPSELEGLKDDANTLHTWSLVSYITGGVLVAAGAGLLTYDLVRNKDEQPGAQGLQLRMDVGVAAGGGWLGVNGRF